MNHCIFVQNATATKYLWIHDAWYQLENWRWRCIQCVINQFRLLIYLAEWFFPNWTFFSTHTARLCDALGLRLGSMLSGWLFTWSQLAAFGGRPRVNCLLPPNALFRLAMAVGCTPMLFPECRTRLWPRVENPAATPAPEYFPKVVKALTMALSVLTSLICDWTLTSMAWWRHHCVGSGNHSARQNEIKHTCKTFPKYNLP